ncbi:MAG: hypothetical protein J6Y87_08720, partial [Muribaculaceae bacterium]|nr:hypothetical protein [Muribaculaceae bacterium]
GVKYAIFRHFDKNSGTISSDDLPLIPDIIKTGEKIVVGRDVTYVKTIDGRRYKVYLTRNKDGEEVFADYYSNWRIEKKKTPIVGGDGTESDTSISSRDSYDAHNLNVESFGDKVTENNSNTQENGGSFSLAEREERIDGVMGGRESIDEWLDTVGRRREGSRYDAEQRMNSEDKAVD